MRPTTRLLPLLAAAALGTTLAACSDPAPTPSDGTAASDDTAQSDATAPAGATAPADGDATETADGSSDGAAACLVGTWQMTPEAMEQQVLAQLGAEGEVEAEGTSTMTFDAGTATIETDSTSAFSIPTDAGVTAEGDARTSGSMVLGYTADDTTITYTEVVSAEGTTTFTINGESNEVDLAETAALMTELTYDYTCTDAELTLTSEIPGLGLEVEQTLTRS